MAGPPHTESLRGTSLKWLTKFTEHFHLCSPTVSPLHTCFHHQWIFIIGVSPPHSFSLSPRWDLRELWMESFSSHMTLSSHHVFRCCWATCSSHRAPLFLRLSDTKATFEACSAACHQQNARRNKRPCCVHVCLWVWSVTRQRNQPLTPCDVALGARRGCPDVPYWSPPFSIFTLSTVHEAVKFNPLNWSLFAINLGLTCPRGQIHTQKLTHKIPYTCSPYMGCWTLHRIITAW